MSILNEPLVGGFSFLQILIAIAALFAVLKVIDLVRGKSKNETEMHVDARCPCGWKGRVSKFARQCPKCGKDVVTG
jgi:hypothetical protein